MDSVDWIGLSPNIPSPLRSYHKGEICIKVAVKEYTCLPWFINCCEVAPLIDIWCDLERFVAVFDVPRSLIIADELDTFRSIVACFKSLKNKCLAFSDLETAFCRGSEKQVCKISPQCQLINDPHGYQLLKNIREAPDLGFFKNERILDALLCARCLKA